MIARFILCIFLGPAPSTPPTWHGSYRLTLPLLMLDLHVQIECRATQIGLSTHLAHKITRLIHLSIVWLHGLILLSLHGSCLLGLHLLDLLLLMLFQHAPVAGVLGRAATTPLDWHLWLGDVHNSIYFIIIFLIIFYITF